MDALVFCTEVLSEIWLFPEFGRCFSLMGHEWALGVVKGYHSSVTTPFQSVLPLVTPIRDLLLPLFVMGHTNKIFFLLVLICNTYIFHPVQTHWWDPPEDLSWINQTRVSCLELPPNCCRHQRFGRDINSDILKITLTSYQTGLIAGVVLRSILYLATIVIISR